MLGPLEQLSSRLGDPPTIAVHLAWARLLVAVAADDAVAARAAADQLAEHVAASRPACSPTPADAFADVLVGVVDADVVRTLAAQMVDRGLVFEASRLVGAAGVRSSDPTVARALLADLRRLRATQVRRGVQSRAVAELSERELDVARAVLEGRTHREIGAQLFISAKTVEHHVARIRQKLGAGSQGRVAGGDSRGARPFVRSVSGPRSRACRPGTAPDPDGEVVEVERVAVDHDDVGHLPRLQRAGVVGDAEQLGCRSGGGGQRLGR